MIWSTKASTLPGDSHKHQWSSNPSKVTCKFWLRLAVAPCSFIYTTHSPEEESGAARGILRSTYEAGPRNNGTENSWLQLKLAAVEFQEGYRDVLGKWRRKGSASTRLCL